MCASIFSAEGEAKQETNVKQAARKAKPASLWFLAWLKALKEKHTKKISEDRRYPE
jgi:hypothetical protein